MQLWVDFEMLALLAIANGTPVIANRMLGPRFAWPLDGGLTLPDGQPLFGASKTLRGVMLATLMTSLGGLLLGFSWRFGSGLGLVAMGGDLFSSFLKRRLKLVAGDRATGLDQIPESLFPLLAYRIFLSLTALDITLVVAMFFFGEMLISIWLFKLHVRERPY